VVTANEEPRSATAGASRVADLEARYERLLIAVLAQIDEMLAEVDDIRRALAA
jgi:hypothetical protein